MLEIHRIDPQVRRDVRRFIELPFRLYRNSPQWVPPFVHEMRVQMDPERHPFYQHSKAAFFVATTGGEVVGRIAVLDNARHNQHHEKQTAFFTHFDAEEDQDVSRALFDAACDWAQKRGMERLWGPKGFLAIDGQGILVKGYEYRPALGVPYNYPYYGPLLESAGLKKSLDFTSWLMDRKKLVFPERILALVDKIKQRRGFQAVSFRSKAELRALIPKVIKIYNESFVDVQGYTPLDAAEGQAIGERILSIAEPQMISLLMKEDEFVGFVIAYPDITAAIQRCRGRLWPTGWYQIKQEFKRTQWLNFNGAGILERYRGLGGNALLYAQLYYTLVDNPQYQFADLAQAQETNAPMMKELEAFGLVPHKLHRVYERDLT